MKCKFCMAEIEEGLEVCPVCGKDLTAKKNNLWKILLAVVGGLVLAAVLTIFILKSQGIKIGPRDNDLYYKNNYTVSLQKADSVREEVIATMGNQELTNSDLQIYYWMGVYEYLNANSSYLSLLGLDLTVPLSEQYIDEEKSMTYQQMFLQSALEDWYSVATMVQLAEENGHTLTQEQQDELDGVKTEIEELAATQGYEDLDQFMADNMSPGVSMDAYLKFRNMDYMASSYYEETLSMDLLLTDDEVEAFYAENEAYLVEQGYGKEAGNYYDVRHILIGIEATGEDENGEAVATDEDWENCRVKAEELYAQFLAGEATEEAFAEMANEHSIDGGSNTNGGLYSGLKQDTNFVPEFMEWYLDESRQVGDTGVVRTDYGYHIMYFSGSEPIWKTGVETMALSEWGTEMITTANEKWPMEVNFKGIVLGPVELG